ncbi:MAG: TIGR02391 family protein [Endomicrobiaceae bacterium]|nr:TIGR02391 family protein [Endomicrobiaceae bacterium]
MIQPYPQFHTKVNEVAQKLYENGHFTDALRKSSIRLEEECKFIYKEKTGEEESGTTLMSKLFCKQSDGKIIMPMVNLSAREGSDRQQSIYFLFSGCIGAIRNPIAHQSADLDDIEALYGLNIVSYLFCRLEKVRTINDNLTPVIVSKDYKLNQADINKLITLVSQSQKLKNLKTKKPLNMELAIKVILDDLVVENLDKLGEELYNYYFSNKENQEEIIEYIVGKLV